MKNEPTLIQKEIDALHELKGLSAQRARAEDEIDSGFATRRQTIEETRQKTRAELTRQLDEALDQAERRYQEARLHIARDFQAEQERVEAEWKEARRQITTRARSAQERVEEEHQTATWEAKTVADVATEQVETHLATIRQEIDEELHRLLIVQNEAQRVLAPWGQARFDAWGQVEDEADTESDEPSKNLAASNPPTGPETDDTLEHPPSDLLDDLRSRVDQAEMKLMAMARRMLPRLFQEMLIVPALLVLAFLIMIPAVWLADWLVGLVVGGATTLVLGAAVSVWLYLMAKRQMAQAAPGLIAVVAQAERTASQTQKRAEAWRARRLEQIQTRLKHEVTRANQAHRKNLQAVQQTHDTDLRQAEHAYTEGKAHAEARRDEQWRQAEQAVQHIREEVQQRRVTEAERIEATYREQIQTFEAEHQDARDRLFALWRDGLARVQNTVREIQDECDRLFLNWNIDPSGARWSAPSPVPDVLRIGQFPVVLEHIAHGQPRDERLRAITPEGFTLPALVPFPDPGALLFAAYNEGKDQATRSLRAVMLRLLTSLPPSKVRFTIIDPVGLGQNFAAFMHLADFDEQLVTSRIWTEGSHIEQRLTDLTEHMENVIQKYLRNEFHTIQEYNAMAGEVAEPYRVLVVANFPVNFSEAAARRLVSVAASGARCGVYVLVSVDLKQALPQGCDLKDLQRHAVSLIWSDGRFLWKHPEFERFPLTLDQTPPAEPFTQLLNTIGGKAKEAGRVEVPFEIVAPESSRWWTADSRQGIDVPLGRAGATRLQHLRLGKGTSQHVLIAGKTGSGKSTLLHALITNTALHYSPEEVELYLIDFKKGVEFKTYATHELPHARVVAIESEREFGLSVLQRLDAELKRRGDLFRAVGAQDLNAYRQTDGQQVLPRILLIVDEFQEFFVEDDRVAQDAALLLDRLVRQGRAFGIHVHLGSQTLSGAYSLARSTLGQMAVRIALQCSETDAHLILSEDNTAARLLSRPGEAIYNDANGLVEGNNFFQVVWLPDERREVYLRQLRDLAIARGKMPDRPAIVFEGNIPADLAKNPRLDRLFRAQDWPSPPPKAAHAWLGDAVAIKDPTAAVFRPQGGANLMIIGQNDEMARAILTSALISLVAQHDPSSVRFVLLDGTPVDSRHAGAFSQLAETLPHDVRVATPRRLPEVMNELAEDLAQRQQTDGAGMPTVYLLVHDLQRFRDLRKADDDFGFGRFGGEERPPSPSQQFADLLREGPPLGLHTLLWCDSYNNLTRALDRQSLREFDLRVLFQMSTADSSNLIDTPVASKLGQNRALFFSEEQGHLEKFRPYAMPDDAWLWDVVAPLGDRPSAIAAREARAVQARAPSEAEAATATATATATSEDDPGDGPAASDGDHDPGPSPETEPSPPEPDEIDAPR